MAFVPCAEERVLLKEIMQVRVLDTLLKSAMVGTALIALVGAASAAEIKVTADITTSTVWTANNTYNLQGQIYVRNGATLTIQAGTVVASDLGGSIAVRRGAKINIQGTQYKPVIMTSKADVATWSGGNPRTGKWREKANEWGNLTIMGDGLHLRETRPS